MIWSGGWFKSLAPGKFEWNLRYLILQIISVIDDWGISCELALRWMSLDLADDKSTLVQVMAWCRQATSHYLSQCWPRSLSPLGVTRPQWVNMPSYQYRTSHSGDKIILQLSYLHNGISYTKWHLYIESGPKVLQHHAYMYLFCTHT